MPRETQRADKLCRLDTQIREDAALHDAEERLVGARFGAQAAFGPGVRAGDGAFVVGAVVGRRALVEGDREGIQAELKVVRSMLDVLGVDPGSPQWRTTGGDTLQGALDVMINEVLAERALARKEKNWARADQLRDRLAAAGIQVEDGPQGVQWQVTAR